MKRLNNLFLTTFCFCMVAFSGKTNAQNYDPAAITVINNLIDKNGLVGYAKDQPNTWNFAIWNDDSPKQLIELDFYSADIFDLTGTASLAGLTNLEYLDCFGNNLTTLNVTGCTKLDFLDCSYNNLTKLDVSSLTNLTYLDCYENFLTELKVSGCISLKILDCEDNNLSQLNVSGYTNIEQLYCSHNYLTTLDVSGLTNLMYLYCYENNLTELNVSGCTNLEELDCEDNSLTALDLTGLDFLDEFYGDDQVVSLILQEQAGKHTCNISLNNPIFNKGTISYNSGVLTSSDKTVTSTYFVVKTGISGYQVRGIMYLEYATEGISEISQNEKLRVYPNPTTGQLRIANYELGNNAVVAIYNVVGQKVQSTTVNLQSETVIDVSHLSAGIYFLKVAEKAVKFVKE